MESPRALQQIRTFREDYERAKANAPTVDHAPESETQVDTAQPVPRAEKHEDVTMSPDAVADAASNGTPQTQTSVPPTKEVRTPPAPQPEDESAAATPTQAMPGRRQSAASTPTTREAPAPGPEKAVEEPTAAVTQKSDTTDKPHNETGASPADDGLADVPDLEAGTIITDKRTTSFRLIPALIDSLRKWWRRQQNRVEDWRTPEYTVTPATERKDIVEKAASQSALAPRDDYAHVSKRLQAGASQTPVRNEVQIKSADEVPAPHWTHTTDTAAEKAVATSPEHTPARALLPAHTETTESDEAALPSHNEQATLDTAPAATAAPRREETQEQATNAAASDTDTAADIPTAPRAADEPVPPKEEAPAPSKDSTAPASTRKTRVEKTPIREPDATPTPVDTTSLPMADSNTGAEVPRSPQPTAQNTPATPTPTPAGGGATAPRAPEGGKRLWFIVVAVGAAALGLGVSVGVWIWLTSATQPEAPAAEATPTSLPRADLPATPERQSAARPDLRINTTARGTTLLSQIKTRSDEVSVSTVTPFTFTRNQTPYSGVEIITRLGLRAPQQFLRNLEAAQIGLHPRGVPYIALRLRSYEIALGGMLQWEDTLVEDLAPLFENISRNATFRDEIINNRDVRVYQGEDEVPELLYVLLDERTVLITGNVDILGDLIRAVRL